MSFYSIYFYVFILNVQYDRRKFNSLPTSNCFQHLLSTKKKFVSPLIWFVRLIKFVLSRTTLYIYSLNYLNTRLNLFSICSHFSQKCVCFIFFFLIAQLPSIRIVCHTKYIWRAVSLSWLRSLLLFCSISLLSPIIYGSLQCTYVKTDVIFCGNIFFVAYFGERKIKQRQLNGFLT